MLSEAGLKNIEVATAKAREGPWHWWESNGYVCFGQVDKPAEFMLCVGDATPDELNLMCAQRTWIPQLLEVIWKTKRDHEKLYHKHLELQQKLDDLREMLDEW